MTTTEFNEPLPWARRMAASFHLIAQLFGLLDEDDARFMLGMMKRRQELFTEDCDETLREIASETIRRLKLKREALNMIEGAEE